MFRKLTVKNRTKKDFIERKASIHICDRNCWIECILMEVPKLSLMSGLNAY